MPEAEKATISAKIALRLLITASRMSMGWRGSRPISRTASRTTRSTAAPTKATQTRVAKNSSGRGRGSKYSRKLMHGLLDTRGAAATQP